MSRVTEILNGLAAGERSSNEELLPHVYDQLRSLARAHMANEKPGQTLDATSLVHEAYLRLAQSLGDHAWASRSQFFAAAGTAMRRILVDAARRKRAHRNGGSMKRVDAELDQFAPPDQPDQVVKIDNVLRKLEQEFPTVARLVELKYFAGFTLKEAAEQLEIPLRTAHRNWAYAKAWIRDAIEQDGSAAGCESSS